VTVAVVEHLTHNPKTEGSDPTVGIGRELLALGERKWQKGYPASEAQWKKTMILGSIPTATPISIFEERYS
jgi:hypothetical protein